MRVFPPILLAILAPLPMLALACGSEPAPEPEDPELARRFDAARAAYEQGQDAQAVGLYQNAARRAYRRDDLQAAARAHYSQAVSYLRMDRSDQADRALDQAAYALRLDGDEPGPDILLLRARLAYLQERPEEAARRAQAVIGHPGAKTSWVQLARAILGYLAVDRGDLPRADQALERMGDSQDQAVLAAKARLAARIARSQGKYLQAAELFEREVLYRRATLAYGSMAQALADAADAYQQADEIPQAATRFLRAGRSAAVAGNSTHALPWLRKAQELARQAGDDTTLQAAQQTLADLIGQDQP
jgi:tetratricopeptide (TPR) repeat protein